MKRGGSVLFLAWIVAWAGCSLVGSEERYSYQVLADATILSVPDSSRYNNIRVRMAGVLGMTTATKFDEIVVQRSDTLFRFSVYARDIYDSRTRYEAATMYFDTTLVVNVSQPPRGKFYYFQLLGANQLLQDSSLVY